MASRRRPFVAALLATFFVFGAGARGAQIPRLVKDLNTAGEGSQAFLQAEMDGFLYLVASEPDHGSELWKTDGTAPGTTLVKDVWPGPAPSEPFFVVNAGGTIFFAPDTEEYGKELWKSDGTEAGTVLVRDIYPGPETSFPERFVAVGNTLFFVARDGIHGPELWKSDGSEAGTTLVKDIFTGEGFEGGPLRLTASGDKVFFRANDGVHGEELWVSDGTQAGTRLVSDINPGERGSTPDQLFDLEGTLFFAADDPDHGEELWKSDGTEAGTVLVQDIWPGSRSSFPYGLAAVGGTLFFQAEDPAHGAELRKSDGTPAGTALVSDLRPGDESGGAFGITDVAGTAFFFAVDPEKQDASFRSIWELWTSDGTEAGTRLVREVRPGSLGFVNEEVLEFNGELVFSGEDEAHGIELWRSDGTEAGTTPIKDIFPGERDSQPWTLMPFGDRILFAAEDDSHGRELWSTDGTEAGTALSRDINTKGTIDGNATALVELDGILYFASEDAASGRELWRSDGTAAGTFIVRDINPEGDGFRNRFRADIVAAGDRIFFYADDGIHGEELWTSDGTASGTRVVEDVQGAGSVGGTALVATERYVYWTRSCKLWRSDGSPEGTVVVVALDTESCPLPVTSLGELVFLISGAELWRSDGTPEGTFAIADVSFLGFKGSLGGEFVPLGDVLLFTVGTQAFERELWRSDGSRAGTFVVKDIAPGPSSSESMFLVEHDGMVFFRADDGVHGVELWQTDGTAAGTSMVADLSPGSASSNPWPLDGVNGTMFFAAEAIGANGESRIGLWTIRRAGSEPRFVSAAAQPFFKPAVAFGGHLYFPFREFATGEELWRSDGTGKGTTLVTDMLPGIRDSRPANFTVAGRNLFFSATSGRFGRELWVVGAGTATGVAGRVTSVPDLDGLGGDEVAALFSDLVVRDAASGEEIVRTPLAPRGSWDAVDFEPLPDLDGNGSSELAILARKRNRMRIFVRDALTGDLLATLRLRRNRHPLDLEVIPSEGADPLRLAVLSRRGLAQPSWLTVTSLAGADVVEVPLGEDFEALDLEVAPALERGGPSALVVLGQSGSGDRARLLAVDPETGLLLADWTLRAGLVPLDLEIVQRRPRARGLAAVLVEKNTNSAIRVLTIDLQTGETLRTVRFGKKYLALDLEAEPGRKGSVGPAISLLEAHRTNGRVRVSSRNALSGRKLGEAEFSGVLLPLDLATVRDLDGSGAFETAVLGEAECAGGGTAIVLRDGETGSRLGCYSVP